MAEVPGEWRAAAPPPRITATKSSVLYTTKEEIFGPDETSSVPASFTAIKILFTSNISSPRRPIEGEDSTVPLTLGATAAIIVLMAM
jgi:hypothetical protein